MKKLSFPLITSLFFGFLFLYIPIITVIVFSFNQSKLVTVWTGFSLKWYKKLFENTEILNAAWLSLKIAASSASLSVFLGTLGALALLRIRRFLGRRFFSTLMAAPLVMPEIIIGFSLLLFFIGCNHFIGWPHQRGFTTVTIAHTILSLAYVFVIIRTRLQIFDRKLEEAALDLGAKPHKVFFYITLPLILPALISGWLLAFTLSLDDLVIATFISGPTGMTLPMMIYSHIRLGVTPEINALATLMIGGVILGVLGSLFFLKKNLHSQ